MAIPYINTIQGIIKLHEAILLNVIQVGLPLISIQQLKFNKSNIQMHEERKQAEDVPLCHHHRRPSTLIYSDPTCPTIFICPSRQCVQRHTHSNFIVIIFYLQTKFKEFEQIKERTVRQVEEMIGMYYDEIANRCLARINEQKEQALRRLQATSEGMYVDLSQIKGYSMEKVKRELPTCTKKQILISWDLLKKEDIFYFRKQNIDHFVQEIKEKQSKFEVTISSALDRMPLNLFSYIETSCILDFETYQKLANNLATKNVQLDNLQLIFNSAEHQFKAQKFHELCDDKGPTLTVIRGKCGFICVCYTSKNWTRDNRTQYDQQGVCFILNETSLYSPTYIYSDRACGPQFNDQNGYFYIKIPDRCQRSPLSILIQSQSKQIEIQNYCVFSFANQEKR